MQNCVRMVVAGFVVALMAACSTEAPIAPSDNGALIDDPQWAHKTPPGTPVGGDWRAAGLTGATIADGCVTMEFTGGSGLPHSWTEKGVTVESFYPGSSTHIHLGGGELDNHSGCCSTPYRFYREDEGLFDLKSLDVTEFGGSDAAKFMGSNGAMRTVTGNGPMVFDGSWRGLEYFEWDNTKGSHHVDNVMVCPSGESCETAVADARDALNDLGGVAARLGAAFLDAVEAGNEVAIDALRRTTRFFAQFGFIDAETEDFLMGLSDLCD